MHDNDSKDEAFMRLALGQAELALKNGWIPVGAIFVQDGRIVAHGCKTGTIHRHFDHAEHNGCYQALWSRDGPKDLKGFTVYSTMEPCVMCMSMLMTTRVSRIVYGVDDPYGGGAYLLENPAHLPERFYHEHPTLISGVLEAESVALLRQFFQTQADAGGWSDPNNALIRRVLDYPD